jgi:hypothetical protein
MSQMQPSYAIGRLTEAINRISNAWDAEHASHWTQKQREKKVEVELTIAKRMINQATDAIDDLIDGNSVGTRLLEKR